MASCGICGGKISNTIVPHGAICEDDRQGKRMPYYPEVDDIIKSIEEERGNE